MLWLALNPAGSSLRNLLDASHWINTKQEKSASQERVKINRCSSSSKSYAISPYRCSALHTFRSSLHLQKKGQKPFLLIGQLGKLKPTEVKFSAQSHGASECSDGGQTQGSWPSEVGVLSFGHAVVGLHHCQKRQRSHGNPEHLGMSRKHFLSLLLPLSSKVGSQEQGSHGQGGRKERKTSSLPFPQNVTSSACPQDSLLWDSKPEPAVRGAWPLQTGSMSWHS